MIIATLDYLNAGEVASAAGGDEHPPSDRHLQVAQFAGENRG